MDDSDEDLIIGAASRTKKNTKAGSPKHPARKPHEMYANRPMHTAHLTQIARELNTCTP